MPADCGGKSHMNEVLDAKNKISQYAAALLREDMRAVADNRPKFWSFTKAFRHAFENAMSLFQRHRDLWFMLI